MRIASCIRVVGEWATLWHDCYAMLSVERMLRTLCLNDVICRWHWQAGAQLICANVSSNMFKLLSILTDLVDEWHLKYLSGNKLCAGKFASRAAAVAFVRKWLQKVGRLWVNENKFGKKSYDEWFAVALLANTKHNITCIVLQLSLRYRACFSTLCANE